MHGRYQNLRPFSIGVLCPPMKGSELEEIMRLVDLFLCVSVCLCTRIHNRQEW